MGRPRLFRIKNLGPGDTLANESWLPEFTEA